MRAYRGARFITGGSTSARARMKSIDKPNAFLASYKGCCRGCGMPYQVGDPIVSDGKGRGAMHPRCHPTRRKQGIFG